jgi:hypothetical protein
MKKKQVAKLQISKTTLTNLQEEQQYVIKGGATNIPEVCSNFDCATLHNTCRTCWSRCGSCTTCPGKPC